MNYEHDENLITLKNEIPPDRLEALLNDAGDRVSVAHKRKGRWAETYHADGRLKKQLLKKRIGRRYSLQQYAFDQQKTGKV